MIEANADKVEISFPKSPITDILYKATPVAFEKAVITTDLRHIFLAISTKYSVGECADIIARALETMVDEFDKQENKDETNSST